MTQVHPPPSPPGYSGDSDVEPMPAPGELQIKERRSWRSWQLATGMIAAVVIGMGINQWAGNAQSAASSNKKAYTLPPATTGSSTTTTTSSTSATTGAGSGSTTTTTVAGGSTTTSVPASTAPTGPAQVLLAPHQAQGNWTSTPFTTTAPGWIIGWAYRCAPVPTGASFQVFVTSVGGSPSGTPAITETGASGQSTTTESSLGQQTLVVQAPAGCQWIVKVVGN